MANQSSLADKLILFMRVRDETQATIDAMPQHQQYHLKSLMEHQEQCVVAALASATDVAYKLGRIAEVMPLPAPPGEKL